MSTIEQSHTGVGDNVAGDKIMVQIKSLAPADLIPPMDLVLESLRKKDNATAKTQMDMLKAMAQRDPEAAALVEVISIYSGLVEAQDHDDAWKTVAKIISTASNHVVKDMCLAALLKLSSGTDREQAARDLFEGKSPPGPYSQETYLRLCADKEYLEAAGKGSPTEAELTGTVEGAARLQLTDLMMRMAKHLDMWFPSYNSRVLLAIATGMEFNPDLARCHFWLNRPEVKEGLDNLADRTAQLFEQSEGTDIRVQELACSIFNAYQGYAPLSLFKTLKKHLPNLDPTRSASIAMCKAALGDETALNESQKELKAASENPQKRTAWCKKFLVANSHPISDIMPFLRLATPPELEEWVGREHILNDASEMEEAYVRLLVHALKHDKDNHSPLQKQELAQHADRFISRWGNDITNLMPEVVFELAEKLSASKLPHKAIEFTSRLIPDDTLWPSQFVVAYLRFLLEAEQYETFEKVIDKIKGAEKSVMILNLSAMKAERMGDIASALKFSDLMVEYAPDMAYAWYQGCHLRARHQSLAEQQLFHQRIPDAVLQSPIPEVMAILGFLTRAGNFKRVEPLWVDWFIQSPRERAVDLVNFHFGTGLMTDLDLDVSATLEQCAVAIEYEQEGNIQTRLILEDNQSSGEYTLRSSSHLGKLLQDLPKGESANLGMATYRVIDRLPPYVGCLRLALRLRHTHNDGSDCFVMMQMPSDPAELVPYLEKKLGQNSDAERRKQLEEVDALPLYIRGHALYPNDAFKSALNCWPDVRIPKSPLWNQGEASPNAIVLDAYGIGYLATTNLVRAVLDAGISFILPAATKEKLTQFINEISDEKFMLLGVADSGRLVRTTASDIRENSAHIVEMLRLVLDNASVAYPMAHDANLEVFSIKEGIDATVYDAIQLSMANNIPWFCMDGAFSALHHANKSPTANVAAIVLRAVSKEEFDFESLRHGFLLYSVGALPLAFTAQNLHSLAQTPNPLASFILFQLIKNHGRQIFSDEGESELLLHLIFVHLSSRYTFGGDLRTLWPRYTPWQIFTDHVFNHGLSLYLSFGKGYTELRLAKAMKYMLFRTGTHHALWEHICRKFLSFAEGHFMSLKIIAEYFQSFESEP